MTGKNRQGVSVATEGGSGGRADLQLFTLATQTEKDSSYSYLTIYSTTLQ